MNVVIDTNVAKVANDRADDASDLNSYSDIPDNCILESIRQIKNVTEENYCLVVDDAGEIFQEYRNNLSLRGQPGVGDAFVKWVSDHQYNSSKVDRVPITKNGSSYEYKEFPDHPDLHNFDSSDRKFVAVANAHPEKPPILQATDSKWWGWKDALAEVGITVCFLCQEFVEKKYADKMGT